MSKLGSVQDPGSPALEALRRSRALGAERPGTVSLRDFDRGVVETIGAFVDPSLPIPDNQRYWLNIEGVDPPPGKPGLVVTFSFPEAEFKSMVLPLVMIRRDDISPALERYHPRHQTYRVPTVSATTLSVNGQTGSSEVEIGYQDIPYDITYTISVLSHYRGALGQRGEVQTIFEYLLRCLSPHTFVNVVDSLDDPRAYFAVVESTAVLDDHPEVAERIIGFGVTLRVEAELSHNTPQRSKTVTQPLTLNLKPL